MKIFNFSSLPDTVNYNGSTYRVNMGITTGMKNSGTPPDRIQTQLKLQGNHGILIKVLSRNLKGKTDLHGKLYQPSQWIFTKQPTSYV